jgi:hypothetical protein
MAHQKIEMTKVEPAQRIEFDFEGSASLAKYMDRRTTSFLCTIEWSWSPANNRMQSYYLQRRRTHWVLWVKHHGDVEEWLSKPIAIARCQRGEGFAQDYKAAAMILLAAVLTEEIRQYSSELDRFHAITDAGVLSTKDLQVVAETVWGKRGQELLEYREEIAAQKAAAEREAKLSPYRVLIDGYVLKFSDAPLPRSYGTERSWVRRFIEDYVLDNGRLPDGKHQIKVVTSFGGSYSGGTHDFSDLKRGSN